MSKFFLITPLILQTAIWIPTRLVFMTIFKLQVKGLNNLSGIRGGVIFAPNHSSELDPILIPASLPFLSKLMPMFYTSREQSFYKYSGWRRKLYGGLLFKLWGAHAVLTGLQNYEKSLQIQSEILLSGKSICLFPEGKKTRDGSLGDGKGGISFLVHHNNVPVIPVAIKGAFRLSLREFIFSGRRISVNFGKPIYKRDLFGDKTPFVTGHEHDDFKEASKLIMKSLKTMLDS